MLQKISLLHAESEFPLRPGERGEERGSEGREGGMEGWKEGKDEEGRMAGSKDS